MFGNSLGSFHQDVLNAQPVDEQGILNLVEEIKNRAKGSLNSKNYPEAIQLYSKGIEVKPSDSILYSNRSMCYLQMGKAKEALDDAEQSIVLDKSYAKAYFRKGSALVALKNYSLAKQTFEEGLILTPGDKSFISQLEKLSQISSSSSSSSPSISPSSSSTSTTTTNQKTPTEVKKKSNKSNNNSSNQVDSNETDSSSTQFRGYKKTSDGRITTFFNNELDDQTKALIGDIAPKKIDSTLNQNDNTTTTNGESVWNKAGTWEERIHTPWAISRLRELLEQINLSIPINECGGGTITLKNSSVTGDAQVTMARGKVKHIYDFTATVDWKLELNDANDANGSFSIDDISGDREYEIQTTITSRGGENSMNLVNKYIKSQNQGVQPLLVNALNQFYEEFQQK